MKFSKLTYNIILIKALPIIFIFIILVCCNSKETSCNNNPATTNNIDSSLSTLPVKNIELTSSLIFFNQSKCIESYEKGEKIISKTLHSDTLSIKITSVQNCETNYEGNFRFIKDTLDLIIKQQPNIIKHKNGKVDTIYLTQECYCLYKFSLKINHIDSLPKIIKLNGKRFRGEWKGL